MIAGADGFADSTGMEPAAGRVGIEACGPADLTVIRGHLARIRDASAHPSSLPPGAPCAVPG